ncbi:hypothetical protein KY092_20670 [Natronomonas gomsonensis]|uniref:hypothetical protein n=1 Tax=Natronomonas gomsonensis TaxID=1046043 RepID=UPI00227C0818|nr:hypothetical protein [Natronomonas gomsonensis]MCY4732947.1 hypothetical protein [Natronomonas gomsonensis]
MSPESLQVRLHQPEYTGENRCLPCTIANTIIALALAAVIALWRPFAGALAFGVFITLIYLRGYLVPGTPELTTRYLPPRVLAWFGKEPPEAPPDATGETDAGDAGGDTEALLRSAGVVEDCPDEDDLCLTEAFESAWWGRIRTLRDEEGLARERLAASLGVDADALAFEGTEGHFAVRYEGDRVGRWPSRAVFYADLAAEPTLAEWIDGWAGLGDRWRTEVLAGLRVFLESCPACEADLEQVESVRESCCGGDVVTVSVDCPACGSRVFAGSHA